MNEIFYLRIVVYYGVRHSLWLSYRPPRRLTTITDISYHTLSQYNVLNKSKYKEGILFFGHHLVCLQE